MPNQDTVCDEPNIPPECLGITGAVNFKKPDESAHKMTLLLESAIAELNIFESKDEARQRKEALIELQDFCNSWIYNKALEYMYPESVARRIKGKIFTFGSYRLGVNFSGADIDALLVAPRFLTRDEFFLDFKEFLSTHERAEDIHAVPLAFVPVLKVKFMGVEIDLLFAHVDQMSISDDFSLSRDSDQLLRNMDDRDVRSVNGVRVTDDILRLVYNKESFKSVLKIVRIWAKRRCIYSNVLGFLGGVSWAILVARICQLWPMATVSTLVANFFKFYGSKWRWPSPVILKVVEESPGLNLPQWDPRLNPNDQTHVMPIITPSYPCQNSTYNVSESHKKFILDQMIKAFEIFRQIGMLKRPFKDLFKPLFFFTYKRYLVVTYHCPELDDKKLFREETSFIESKLRLLPTGLEMNQYVESAVIYMKSYDRLENRVSLSPEGAGDGEDSSTNTTGTTEITSSTTTSSSSSSSKQLVRRWIVGLELKKLDKDLMLVEEIKRFRRMVNDGVDVTYYLRKEIYQFLPADEVALIKEKMQKNVRNRKSSKAGSGDSVNNNGDATGAVAGVRQEEGCNIDEASNPETENNRSVKKTNEEDSQLSEISIDVSDSGEGRGLLKRSSTVSIDSLVDSESVETKKMKHDDEGEVQQQQVQQKVQVPVSEETANSRPESKLTDVLLTETVEDISGIRNEFV